MPRKPSARPKSPAIVLEGGAMRGIFTAGVVDVLLENRLDGFSEVWGTSAGAINSVSFKSRQLGRQMRGWLAFRDDRRMMSLFSLARTGNIVGNDFLYYEVQSDIDPFDSEAFEGNPMRMWACASDVVFGQPAYLEVAHLPEDMPKVIASASMPLLSSMVEIDGHLYLDGGGTDSVPVEVALGLEGARRPEDAGPAPERALVVLTRPRDYVRPALSATRTAAYRRRYDQYPYYLEALLSRPERYNAQHERILELEREGRVVVIAPAETLAVGLPETSGERLLRAYLAGRSQAEASLDAIRELLS